MQYKIKVDLWVIVLCAVVFLPLKTLSLPFRLAHMLEISNKKDMNWRSFLKGWRLHLSRLLIWLSIMWGHVYGRSLRCQLWHLQYALHKRPKYLFFFFYKTQDKVFGKAYILKCYIPHYNENEWRLSRVYVLWSRVRVKFQMLLLCCCSYLDKLHCNETWTVYHVIFLYIRDLWEKVRQVSWCALLSPAPASVCGHEPHCWNVFLWSVQLWGGVDQGSITAHLASEKGPSRDCVREKRSERRGIKRQWGGQRRSWETGDGYPICVKSGQDVCRGLNMSLTTTLDELT